MFTEMNADSAEIIRLRKETEADITVSVIISILAQPPSSASQATENADYSISTFTYDFAPSDVFRDIPLTILADSVIEGLEGFTLDVRQAQGSESTVLPGEIPTTDVFITDNDRRFNYNIIISYSCTCTL